LPLLISARHSKRGHSISLRLFFRFLYQEKHIDKNFEYLFGKNRFPRREKLPSIYDAVEIKQIEDSINQASAVGKRNYAIFLLASRLSFAVIGYLRSRIFKFRLGQ
jgi:site-specific recombinase XerD